MERKGGGGDKKVRLVCESGLLFYFLLTFRCGVGGLRGCYLLSNLASKANHSQSV